MVKTVADRGAPRSDRPAATTSAMTTTAPGSGAPNEAADIGGKAQEFAHRIVEFADFDACCRFFQEKAVDFDKPNDAGWTILMRICSCGRADLVGYAADVTTNVSCATVPNRTNVLHLAAMSSNSQVIQELAATPERRAKLRTIVDSPNINGDTPLMMACVAKNVDAVRVLLSDLQASAAYGNANGMTALMCAARLSVEAAQDLEEDMAASSTILKLLLASEVHVNASEITSGNTALHFALLSRNVRGVQVLTDSAVDVDILVKNLAGLSAFNVGKLSRATPEIMECLQRKFKEAELAAAERSRALEKELMQSDSSVAGGGDAEKKIKNKKAKGSKSKKNAGSNHPTTDQTETKSAIESGHEVANNEEDNEPVTALPAQGSAVLVTPSSRVDHAGDIESQDWQEVATKKNRRKISIAEEKKAAPSVVITEKPRPQKTTSSTSTKPKTSGTTSAFHAKKSSSEQIGPVSKSPPPTPVPVPTAHSAARATFRPAPSNSFQSTTASREHPGARVQTKSEQLGALNRYKQYESERQRQDASIDESSFASSPSSPLSPNSASYHKLNAIFHRTFPMADELDIPVESFVIASSSTDIELQPSDDGLSISQLEVLQEAHLKAYHYLNEKKMELTRVLEAQRLEAQFALQNEILHLN